MFVVAYPALAVAAAFFAARSMPDAPRLERACAAAVLVPGLSVGLVYALGAAHAIAPWPWLAATLVTAGIAVAVGGRAARDLVRADLRAAAGTIREVFRAPASLTAIALAKIVVLLAIFSAWMLAPWAWDSVGYHLPIVHDALQTGTLRQVPTSVIYVNCYPRLVDVSFVAWALSFPSDRLIELGQLPFVPAAILAIASVASRAGVPTARALGLASLWIALPVAMLELAAAYVDVAVAALALSAFALATSRSRGALLVAGVAAGLLLGSKPSAPPIAAVAALTIFVRGWRSGARATGTLGALLVPAIGAWKYVENLIVWSNPIWPAEVHAGPITFPGKVSMATLATSNLREPYLSMGWLGRVLSSWTALPEGFVYDMRIGGFGPLFTFVLLPLAVLLPLTAWRIPRLRAPLRSVALPVALIALSTLASPGAFWARYTLALPGALLALAIAGTAALNARARLATDAVLVLAAIVGVVISWRGFTEGGPSLFAIAAMAPEDRAPAYALDEEERLWENARSLVAPGEAFGFDPSFGLPGRLWRSDGRGRIAYVDEATPTLGELNAWIDRERVRVVVLGEGETGDADLARAHPERFRELFASSYDWQPCAVFQVLD